MTTISALIMASNEEQMLPGCLAMLGWAEEVIVLIDERSTDTTAEVARAAGARVYEEPWRGFAGQRDRLAELATSDWLLYVDADERTTREFATEVRKAITDERVAGYSIPTLNVFLGRALRSGGWWPDRHFRLIRKSTFGGWAGSIHEVPEINGATGVLSSPIVHLGHRDLGSMLSKTVKWSQIEGQRRAATGRRVRVRSLIGAAGRDAYRRLVRERGWRDGVEGWIEILYQSFSSFLSVARAWELQRGETLDETYRRLDAHLQAGEPVETFR